MLCTPNIALAIPSPSAARFRQGDARRIHVHKAVSMATSVTIATTPIHQPSADHQSCNERYRRRAPRKAAKLLISTRAAISIVVKINLVLQMQLILIYPHEGVYLLSQPTRPCPTLCCGLILWKATLISDQVGGRESAEARTRTASELLAPSYSSSNSRWNALLEFGTLATGSNLGFRSSLLLRMS